MKGPGEVAEKSVSLQRWEWDRAATWEMQRTILWSSKYHIKERKQEFIYICSSTSTQPGGHSWMSSLTRTCVTMAHASDKTGLSLSRNGSLRHSEPWHHHTQHEKLWPKRSHCKDFTLRELTEQVNSERQSTGYRCQGGSSAGPWLSLGDNHVPALGERGSWWHHTCTRCSTFKWLMVNFIWNFPSIFKESLQSGFLRAPYPPFLTLGSQSVMWWKQEKARIAVAHVT